MLALRAHFSASREVGPLIMDPDANLREQQELWTTARRPDGTLHSYDRYRLYDLRVALRDWLRSGGVAPDWDRYPKAAAAYTRWSTGR